MAMRERDDRIRYWSILVAQLFLLFVAAAMKGHPWMRLVFAVTMIAVFGTVIFTIWSEAKIPRILAIATAGIAISCGVLGHIIMGTLFSVHFSLQEGYPIDWMMVVSMASYLFFIVIAILSIGRHVFFFDRVTGNVIAGGICLYVLIGMAFAFIYATIALVVHNVFVIEGALSSQIALTDYFYFSYSSLTTMGFSDITSGNAMIRTIAFVEACIGSLFIAIMIAGLVATYFSQRKNPPHL
jgi:hypothetical protein